MRINQTIRENMIAEIDNSKLSFTELSDNVMIYSERIKRYCEGQETILNGDEIQRIFNYLHEQK